jgi:ribosomal protein S12 methylthiotransferase
MKALCEGLSELDAWVRLHYVYPYPHVDDVVPLMARARSCRTWTFRSSTPARASSS